MSNINRKSIQLTESSLISEEVSRNAVTDTSRLFVQCSGITSGSFTIEQKGETTGWQKFPISMSNQTPMTIVQNIAGIEIRTTKFLPIRFVADGLSTGEVIKIDIYC
jgi:hypothetical protein